MRCQECGALADEQAWGWRAYRCDLVDEYEVDEPELVFYRPVCAAREFGPLHPHTRHDERR
jgi:hypothetical protein